MRLIVRFFIPCLCFLSFQIVYAQDYFFSQFYNTPLMTNAANTGRIKEDFRIGLINRRQWLLNNALSFNTLGFSGDVNFRKKILGADMVGLGVVVVSDQQSDVFGRQVAILSTGWHRHLDDQKRHYLSLGLQVGYSQISANAGGLQFLSAYDRVSNDFSGPSEDVSGLTPSRQVLLHSGFFYDFSVNKKLEVFAGFNAFNLVQPDYSVLGAERLPMRTHMQAGFTYYLSNQVFVTPQMFWARQSASNNMLLGANLGYIPGLDRRLLTLYAGFWYRMADAAIVYGGLKYKNIQLGLSYDFTVSSLNQVRVVPETKAGIVGAFEISLLFHGFLGRAVPSEQTIPCQIF